MMGQFCRHWKIALVRPLLKKVGLELVSSNYRPVSNLPFISKIVEKCMLLQFNKHCEDNQLLPDYQSAYREGYSCETSLLRLHNDILWNMEKGMVTAHVICDLSAAFDTVSHETLLHVLEKRFGVHRDSLRWFDSYLRPRSLRVTVGDSLSAEMNLSVSVPQGSVAGANIFTTYSSTLDDVVPKKLNLNGFADDHSIRTAFDPKDKESIPAVKTELEEAMSDIKEWMNKVRLKMNDSKSEFILYSSNRIHVPTGLESLNVNGTEVSNSSVVRLLGAWLDKELNMKHHVKMKAKSASMNLQRLKKIRPFLTQDAAKTLVVSLVLSHLDYANSLLMGLPSSTIKILQKIQDLAAKIVLGRNKYSSSMEARKELHWLPVIARIKFKVLTLVHKCLYSKAPQYLRSLLEPSVPNRPGLRSSTYRGIRLNTLRTFKKTQAARSFSVEGPRLWNLLPENIRLIELHIQFRKELKTFLFINPNV